MKYTYLLIDVLTILVPFIFSFHPKIRFDREWKRFVPAMLFTALIFISWDAYFTSIGVWRFNENYTVGWNVLGLPVEELLFFICIPYACVFTYFCLTRFYRLSWLDAKQTQVCILFTLLLFTIGLLNITKLYTSVTFISTAIILLFLHFIQRVKWLSKAITVYMILLIPFFIVNGLLTGTGADAAVVIYNNNENLSLRILTIPVEDIAYGFELFVLNLFFYTYGITAFTNVSDKRDSADTAYVAEVCDARKADH